MRAERHLASGAADVGEREQALLVGEEGHPLGQHVVAGRQQAGRAGVAALREDDAVLAHRGHRARQQRDHREVGVDEVAMARRPLAAVTAAGPAASGDADEAEVVGTSPTPRG